LNRTGHAAYVPADGVADTISHTDFTAIGVEGARLASSALIHARACCSLGQAHVHGAAVEGDQARYRRVGQARADSRRLDGETRIAELSTAERFHHAGVAGRAMVVGHAV